jgi:Cdc6-like AAA superfamily ATPase
LGSRVDLGGTSRGGEAGEAILLAEPRDAASFKPDLASFVRSLTMRVYCEEQGVPGFKSTEKYIATRDLEVAVNAAVTLQRPLLVKGEPGTGKTVLAHEVAAALNRPLIEWHIKSTTKAQQGLYEYDAVSRLRDGQLGDPRVHDIGNYIVRGKLWDAFEADEQTVVLIDEVDKADIEFPNDLLLELDRMQFFVYETRKTIVAKNRPVVMPSCAAASSTTSASPTAKRWSGSSRRITPTSARTSLGKP